jgi:hypothetical protein
MLWAIPVGVLLKPVRSIHCVPACAVKVIPPPRYLSLTIPTFPPVPTTFHPVKACPRENSVKPPTGTSGVSKPPFSIRLLVAGAALLAAVGAGLLVDVDTVLLAVAGAGLLAVADVVLLLQPTINALTVSATQATPR